MTDAERAFLDATIARHLAQQRYDDFGSQLFNPKDREKTKQEHDALKQELHNAYIARDRAETAFVKERLP